MHSQYCTWRYLGGTAIFIDTLYCDCSLQRTRSSWNQLRIRFLRFSPALKGTSSKMRQPLKFSPRQRSWPMRLKRSRQLLKIQSRRLMSLDWDTSQLLSTHLFSSSPYLTLPILNQCTSTPSHGTFICVYAVLVYGDLLLNAACC